ncbi:dienelactone hydrolase family protein [Microvirga sp. W0021]|uniref:Dienelactone hydrolase family protein n=1 Tax=Hohaiivirga grylli TaxID=3133970 RepID=A0ABV0BKE7_9HYPH
MHAKTLVALTFAILATASYAHAAVPPTQAEQGAGGMDYTGSEVIKRSVGSAEEPIFVFYAKEGGTEPRPVIVFFHSWGGNNPRYFGNWIEHLARKGNLVLFPKFQEVNKTRPMDATTIASRMVSSALKALSEDDQVRPDKDKIAFVGYLAGSIVALDLAAGAKGYDLPEPKLVMSLMPGGVAKEGDSKGIPMPDLSNIPTSTMLITMNGDQDHVPADRLVKRIMAESTGVPAAQKLFMRVVSDRHGYPPLSATLVAPGAVNEEYAADKIPLPPSAAVEETLAPVKGKGKGKKAAQKDPRVKWTSDMALTGPQSTLTMMLGNNGTDNLDYRAFWKTLDLVTDAAFAGKEAVTLKANPAFLDMGIWSDGWPVRRLSADSPKDGREEADTTAATKRRRF